MGEVTTVPVAPAMATGSMSSTAPPSMDTREGGRWTAPEFRSFEPTNPNFHSSLRWAAVLETRAGGGRRGGGGSSWPRHERNLAYVIGAPLAIWVLTLL